MQRESVRTAITCRVVVKRPMSVHIKTLQHMHVTCARIVISQSITKLKKQLKDMMTD